MDSLRENQQLSRFSGSVIGVSLSSYLVRELLICWLILSFRFVVPQP